MGECGGLHHEGTTVDLKILFSGFLEKTLDLSLKVSEVEEWARRAWRVSRVI